MFLKKIKINHLNSGYWLAPKEKNIFSPHNKDYIYKIFPSLEKLLELNELKNKDVCLNFNGDTDFQKFNTLQKIKGLNFAINEKIFQQIFEQKQPYEWEVIPNLIIYLDLKALKVLDRGIIPFYSKHYFEQLFKEAKSQHFINGKAYYQWSGTWGFVQKSKL